MALTLNTGHSFYAYLNAFIAVDDDNVVKELKNGVTITKHADCTIQTGTFGRAVRTLDNGGYAFKGLTFPPIAAPSSGKLAILVVVNAKSGQGNSGHIVAGDAASRGVLSVDGSDKAHGYDSGATSTSIGSSARSILLVRDGDDDATHKIYIDGTLDSAFSGTYGMGYGNSGHTIDSIGGWAGQGYCAADVVFVAIIAGKLPTATDASNWHASLTGSNAFDMLTSGGGSAPAFTGTIPTINATQGVAITPVNLATYFTGATSYAITGTALPAGLALSSVGMLSGTATTLATTTGHVTTGTGAVSPPADSNGFSIVVAAPITVTTGVMTNNTDGADITSTAVVWEYKSGGRFGVSGGTSVYGSGTTEANGTLVLAGLPTGTSGDLIWRDGTGAGAAVGFQAITVP